MCSTLTLVASVYEWCFTSGASPEVHTTKVPLSVAAQVDLINNLSEGSLRGGGAVYFIQATAIFSEVSVVAGWCESWNPQGSGHLCDVGVKELDTPPAVCCARDCNSSAWSDVRSWLLLLGGNELHHHLVSARGRL